MVAFGRDFARDFAYKMAITKEQRDWLAFRKAVGNALVEKDLVEIDYEFDIPEDLPKDSLELLNSLDNCACSKTPDSDTLAFVCKVAS